jgi:SRSO17 transposase
MNTSDIAEMRTNWKRFLRRFEACASDQETRNYFRIYMEGLISDLPRKNCEAMALDSGVPVRSMQWFLAGMVWDHEKMRNKLQRIVAKEHAGRHSVGVIDETSFVKKGKMTPGVQHQYCGTVGKQENCVVTVHLAYAVGDFHTLVDQDLFLPESWSEDRQRCRKAGIPDDVVYRAKWEIALEQYDRATKNGIVFEYLTFDEGYGDTPEFLRQLDARSQRFIGEVRKDFYGWTRTPKKVLMPKKPGKSGRRQRIWKTISVENMLKYSPVLRDQPWVRYYIKDSDKGPVLWDVKHTTIIIREASRGGPLAKPWRLIVARSVMKDEEEIKYFISNTPEDTPIDDLLLAAFSRWRVERSFEDTKQKLGLGHYEGRHYTGLIRHLLLCSLLYYFLQDQQLEFSKKTRN